MLDCNSFRTEFEKHTADFEWEIEGFVDKRDRVHPIDTDTKVISTVFERLCSPVLRTIAKDHGYGVEIANQTTYPDFTLTHARGHRIGIDVKTTYVRAEMAFTLGGYNSFLRNNTKNILHPYDSYADHWIIGFVYSQRPAFKEYLLHEFPKRGDIPCPYEVSCVFVREKHEIAGLRAGSGNTKNIGSIRLRDAKLFKSAQGPFTAFGNAKAACDHFWRNYEKFCPVISSPAQLRAHPDFQQFEPLEAPPESSLDFG